MWIKKRVNPPKILGLLVVSTFSSIPTANATTKPNNILIEKEKQAKEWGRPHGHTELYLLVSFIDFSI